MPACARRARQAGLCSAVFGIFLSTALSTAAVPVRGQDAEVFYERLTPGDVVFARAVLQDTLEKRRSLQPAPWRNDITGNSGMITPVRTFRVKGGFYCRDFRETFFSDGKLNKRVGTACRREDGVWVQVDQ